MGGLRKGGKGTKGKSRRGNSVLVVLLLPSNRIWERQSPFLLYVLLLQSNPPKWKNIWKQAPELRMYVQTYDVCSKMPPRKQYFYLCELLTYVGWTVAKPCPPFSQSLEEEIGQIAETNTGTRAPLSFPKNEILEDTLEFCLLAVVKVGRWNLY